MHFIALHDVAGSSNPLGISGLADRLAFSPYFIFKDLITVFIFILVLSIFVFFMPNALGDSENYVIGVGFSYTISLNIICESVLYQFFLGIFILSGYIFTVSLKTVPLRAPLSKLNIFKTVNAPKNIRYYTTSSNLLEENSTHAPSEVPALTSAATKESSSLSP
jgi:ubiquinol-cytochrome c reductase cytochrome b subunit